MNRNHHPVTASYLDACVREGAAGLRTVTRRLRFRPHFTAAHSTTLLARPLFVERTAIRRLADRLTDFHALLTSVPERLFNGDTARYCAQLGIPAPQARLLRRTHNTPAPLYGRADLHQVGTDWKLLEFNVGSELGGMERASEIPQALLQADRFREFAHHHDLRHVDTCDAVARMLTKAAATVSGTDTPIVALLETDGRITTYGTYIRPFQESMRARGVDLRLAELGQLTEKHGKIHLGDAPVDVLLRYVTVDQICAHPSGEELLEPVLRARENGRTALVTPLSSCLYESKGILAVLSAPHLRPALTEAERALIDDLLPWTRTTTEARIDVDGDTVDLTDYSRAHRTDLILKPNDALRGEGILAGWETTDRDWTRAVHDAIGGNFVIQRKVPPHPEPVCDPDTGAIEDWLATWGVFLTDEGYAGTYIRALPAGADSTVITWDGPRRATGVFDYPDNARPAVTPP
ncbi:glutathionylspermidine synthase family protein [Streptomyces sp. NPDC090442]|uniref:glutathionylspermidine synthase family protein n=1 Tax=Streptomyces sp. NPDC090442 TaxID=3365962 RepID=UPI003800253C